jgi:hypothetical protein
VAASTATGCPAAPLPQATPPAATDAFPAINSADPADAPLLTYAAAALQAPVTTEYEPWLFDRASVAYIFWKRSGRAEWKAEWERLFGFYRQGIDAQGNFIAKPGDTKYVYVRPFYYYEKETGDTQYRPIAKRAYDAWVRELPDNWNPSTSFWTEREIGLALDAAIFYHKLTGDAGALTRARALVAQWSAASAETGAPLHTLAQHGEEFDNSYASMRMTSPWMSALYFQALREYYRVTGDQEALHQASRYVDFLDQYGIVDGSAFHPGYAGTKVPYYLFGVGTYYDRETPSEADAEHCLDVSGLIRFGLEAKGALGQSTSRAQTRFNEMRSCAARRFSELGGRISPPRKWNWWVRGSY